MLRDGAEVRIKIVERESVDKPPKRFPRERVSETKAERRQLRMLAKKFGWTFTKKH